MPPVRRPPAGGATARRTGGPEGLVEPGGGHPGGGGHHPPERVVAARHAREVHRHARLPRHRGEGVAVAELGVGGRLDEGERDRHRGNPRERDGVRRLGRPGRPPGPQAPDLLVGGPRGAPRPVRHDDDPVLAAAARAEPRPRLLEHPVVRRLRAERLPALPQRVGQGRRVGQGADGLDGVGAAQRLVVHDHRRPLAVAEHGDPREAQVHRQRERPVEVGRGPVQEAAAVHHTEVRHARVHRQRSEARPRQLDRRPPRHAVDVVAHRPVHDHDQHLRPRRGPAHGAGEQRVPGVPVRGAVRQVRDRGGGVVDAERRPRPEAGPDLEPARPRRHPGRGDPRAPRVVTRRRPGRAPRRGRCGRGEARRGRGRRPRP